IWSQTRLLTLACAEEIDRLGAKNARDKIAMIKVVVPTAHCESGRQVSASFWRCGCKPRLSSSEGTCWIEDTSHSRRPGCSTQTDTSFDRAEEGEKRGCTLESNIKKYRYDAKYITSSICISSETGKARSAGCFDIRGGQKLSPNQQPQSAPTPRPTQ
ncbi:hypothetical protein THAOC_00202, partial [Thalassiosira oceanica]